MPNDFLLAEAGVIKSNLKLSHAERIGLLHDSLVSLIEELQPDVVVLEKAFYGVNVSSALKLGETRGALIAAARRFSLPVRELTPASVKKTIAGNGRASKEEVNLALRTLLKFELGSLPHDVSDAVALALCYGLSYAFESRLIVGSKNTLEERKML